MPLQDCCFPTQFRSSEGCNIQCLARSCGLWVEVNQGYAQFRAEFTHLIFQKGAVSIDEKDNRELDIIFSKMWSENFSNIFVKEFCSRSSSTAVSYPHVIRISLCDCRWLSLAWPYQHGRWGSSFHKQRRQTPVLWTLKRSFY